MSIEASLLDDIQGTSLQVTPTLNTWTESRSIYDFLPDGVDEPYNNPMFWLLEAYNSAASNDLITVGSPHPRYKHAYAVGCTLTPKTTDSTTHIIQQVTYQQPGPQCEVQFDAYQQTEVRNFDIERQLTLVTFKPTGALGQQISVSGLTREPFVADINVPKIVRSIRITQWEDTSDVQSPADIGETYQPFWNNNSIWGYAAGTLLYMGRQAFSSGTLLVRFEYTFLHNPYGWHHFYAIWNDARGFIWKEIKPIDPKTVTVNKGTVNENGTAAFVMLSGSDFASNFFNLKPPFNVGNGDSQVKDNQDLPATGANAQGDFPVFPGNFA